MSTYLYWTLPMPVVAMPGSTQSLPTMLMNSFGASPIWNTFWVTYYPQSQLDSWDFRYWNVKSPSVATWYVSGTDIGGGFDHQRYLADNEVSTAVLHAGNDIGPFAYVMVPANSVNAEYIEYSVITVDPHVFSPVAGLGEPTPQDIVDTAHRFAAYYGDGLVPNDNDCQNIAEAVAAATGATFAPRLLALPEGLDPSINQEGGFWRIVYRGSDPDPVSNWHTLVQPGDIVRMGWTGGGQHTTTILSVNPDASMTVYDNEDWSPGFESIGVHTANYDQQTIPTTITIWRLTSDGLYLENGTNADETLPGTIFNDHILGLAGNDTLFGAPGNDVLDGGPGADWMIGGTGNDTYYVDNTGDQVIEFQDEGHDTVYTTLAAYSLGDGPTHNVENLGASNNIVHVFSGNGLSNTIYGGAGDDSLNGAGGADTLVGRLGNDSYIVDDVGDVIIELAGEGTDTVYTTLASYALGNGPTFNVENLTGWLDTGQLLVGNGLANHIIAQIGNDTIRGRAGADIMEGDKGNDVIDGGAGTDTAIFSGKRAEYTITITSNGTIILADSISNRDGIDSLMYVEALQFSDGIVHPTLANVRAAALGVLRTLDSREGTIVAQIDAGHLSLDQYTDQLVSSAQSTTVPALVTYDFFFGNSPSAGGLDFLSSFAAQIQTPAGGGLSVVNTFVNLAATEAINPLNSFTAQYGVIAIPSQQTFFSNVYSNLFGHAPSQAAIDNYFKTQTFNLPNGATITGTTFDFYREYVRESLPVAQQTVANLENGARGAVIGTLLYFAEADPTTQYAQSTKHFLQDAAVETPIYQASLIGTYLASSTPLL